MGGKTAMNYAVNYPDNLSKLIIADIGPKQYPTHHQDILKALSALDFSIVKTRKIANEVISEYIKNDGVRQFLAKNLYWKHPDELALRINLPVLIENIEEVGKLLSENSIYHKETLFVRGANSNYIENEDELLIKNHFPNSEIQTIENAGHWLHAENPKDFYNEVMNFISI